MTFPSAPMPILHSRDALELVVELECHFQKHCLCKWNGNTAVGWPSGVECCCFLLVESQHFVLFCELCECICFPFKACPCIGLMAWFFQLMIAAAHGLPWVVLNLSQALVPCFICWKQWSLSQVVKISRVSTCLILDQVCLCWRLSYVWIIL